MEDMKVDMSVFVGLLNQSGMFTKNPDMANPQESFDQIFENSMSRTESDSSIKNQYAVSDRHNPESKQKSSAVPSAGSYGNTTGASNNGYSNNVVENESVEDYNDVEMSETGSKPSVKRVDSDSGTGETAETYGTDTTVAVKMSDIAASAGLDEKKLAELADLLGITIDELLQASVEIKREGGKTTSITALLQNGGEIDLAEAFGIKKDGMLLSGNEAIEKLAQNLNLTKAEAEKFIKELNIKSVETANANLFSKAENEATSQQSPFYTGKAAESKVVENTEKKLTVNAPQENVQQNEAEAAKDLKAERVQTNDKFGGEMKDASAQAKTQTTGKPSEGGTSAIGQKVTTENATETASVKEAAKPSTSARIMGQIVEQARVLTLPGRTEAKITLSPANLGTVEIKILVQDAQVKGSLVVESQQVKKIVEENIASLKTALADQGIGIDDISVSVNDRQPKFEQSSEGFGSGSNREHGSARHGGDVSDKGSVEEPRNGDIRKTMKNNKLYIAA